MCKGACSSLGAVDIAEGLQCMDASIPLFLLSSMLIRGTSEPPVGIPDVIDTTGCMYDYYLNV
jgi:hypothetical protein